MNAEEPRMMEWRTGTTRRFTHSNFVSPIRAALASARFIPALRNGRPIAVRVRQRVAFQVR